MPAKVVCQINSLTKCSHTYCAYVATQVRGRDRDGSWWSLRDDVLTFEPRALTGLRVA